MKKKKCVPCQADTTARSVIIEKLKMTMFILHVGQLGDLEKKQKKICDPKAPQKAAETMEN